MFKFIFELTGYSCSVINSLLNSKVNSKLIVERRDFKPCVGTAAGQGAGNAGQSELIKRPAGRFIKTTEEGYTMAHAEIAQQIEQFKKVAPAIVSNVKARITDDMAAEEIMRVIHDEILSFFVKQQQMTVEYVIFNEDQRINFAALMYTLLEPLAGAFKGTVNPKYAAYVAATGKTGARSFIVNA